MLVEGKYTVSWRCEWNFFFFAAINQATSSVKYAPRRRVNNDWNVPSRCGEFLLPNSNDSKKYWQVCKNANYRLPPCPRYRDRSSAGVLLAWVWRLGLFSNSRFYRLTCHSSGEKRPRRWREREDVEADEKESLSIRNETDRFRRESKAYFTFVWACYDSETYILDISFDKEEASSGVKSPQCFMMHPQKWSELLLNAR